MDKKVISYLLKIVVILVFLVFLFVGFAIVPSYMRFIQRYIPAIGAIFTGVWGYINLSFVPVYICLFLAWQTFTTLGQDNAFCPDNVKRLCRASHLAMVDVAMVLLFFLFLRLNTTLSFLVSPFFLFVTICLILLGLAAALVCFALSKLVAQAAELKQEVDLTVHLLC